VRPPDRAHGPSATGAAEGETRRGFLHVLASDYKALLSLVGLLVYGVVRVAYDAYYTRLGVFPEAVGLSETTILGRAALYLALTVSVAAIFGGLWLLAVTWSLKRSRARSGSAEKTANVLFVASLVLVTIAAGLVAAGGILRSLLGSDRLTYYCFLRCRFAALDPDQVEEFQETVRANEAEHPAYRVVDFGPLWLIAVPLILLAATAVLGLVLARRGGLRNSRARCRVVFVLLAAASVTAGLLAPHLIRASESASREGSSLVDAHPSFVTWAVFVLVLTAVGASLLAVLDPLVGEQPMRSPWLIASFFVVVPILFGFFAPNVPHFIEEGGWVPVAAAVGLWAALLLLSFWLWPNLRDGTVRATPTFGFLLALIVSLTLFLAWERGMNLAERAAAGDQIYAERFSLLSVRANVVCLEPTREGTAVALPRLPYTYLGEAAGTLVLYDFVRDRAVEVPTSFPLRMPKSDVVVRIANYPGLEAAPTRAGWACFG
jgi:hypothetical protein